VSDTSTREETLPAVRLKTARSIAHPWIFSAHIEKPEAPLRPGTLVHVHDANDRWLAYAHYNGHARIALRVLSTQKHETVNARWFQKRIAQAIALRDALGIPNQSNAYRLVHAEGDRMSGVIVDRFADVIVTQFFSAGMYRQRALLRAELDQHFPNAQHYWFADKHIGKQESFDCVAPAAPDPVHVSEHGLQFFAAPGAGHKTGFFADQRDNRQQLAALCAGAKVLDLCCNAGGFGIYAAALGKAAQVTGVDLDPGVIALAERNAALNAVSINYVCADLFDFVQRQSSARQFDVVVLDPAKMTRSADQVREALQTYYAMNRRALAAVKTGGWLLSCSCTGRVSEAEFLDMLSAAASAEKRQLQIVRVNGAGGDHPVLADVPESRYLKAVFARVLG
jgi:23S rRNA (cytosine1962-C5)-methyltransferase